MYPMRIGESGHEKPVVRVDETHYVDVSDEVSDFDEAFFAGGLTHLAATVGARTAAGQVYLKDEQAAREAIAGFTLVNDVSEREFQMERGGQWSKGKSCETFNPAGPWLATPDEFDDVRNLRLTLSVNGVGRQDGNTADMIFDPYFLVHYLSQFWSRVI